MDDEFAIGDVLSHSFVSVEGEDTFLVQNEDNIMMGHECPTSLDPFEELEFFNLLPKDDSNAQTDDDRDSDYVDPFDSGLKPKAKKSSSSRRPRDSKRFSKRQKRNCGRCRACLRTEDCMVCKYCLDMPKYGGIGTKRQKCLLRQCFQLSRLAEMNRADVEMLLGEDVPTAPHAEETPEPPSIIYLDHSYSSMSAENAQLNEYCIAHKMGSREQLMAKRKERSAPKHKSRTSTHRKDTKAKRPSTAKKQKQKEVETEARFDYCDMYIPRRTRRQQDMYAQLFAETVKETQCLGPGCVYAARLGSKYCSDECGVKLASLRLKTFFPEREKEWNATPCVATQSDEQKLQKLAINQEQLQSELSLLDERKNELEQIIDRARRVSVIEEPEITDADTEGDLDLQVYCITCGHAVGFKKALIHMERCYAKVESLITFGSSFKTRCEGESIFCEYFSRKQKTYCKRLRVLCPEHQKEPKVGPDEACGCPLSDNMIAKSDDMDMCHLPKRSCPNHTGWERLRRAQIDLQRLQLWLKLEECQEKEHLIRRQIAHRGGVLGLLLNRTISH